MMSLHPSGDPSPRNRRVLRRRPHRSFLAGPDRLEEKRLLTATVELSVGILTIQGTSGGDDIRVQQFGEGTLVVSDAGRVLREIDLSSDPVVRIDFLGDSGDDRFDATGVRIDVSAEGHSGDDVLIGGDGDDLLNGGNGIDSLFGGPGRDFLRGGIDAQVDVMTGGEGADTFHQESRTVGGEWLGSGSPWQFGHHWLWGFGGPWNRGPRAGEPRFIEDRIVDLDGSEGDRLDSAPRARVRLDGDTLSVQGNGEAENILIAPDPAGARLRVHRIDPAGDRELLGDFAIAAVARIHFEGAAGDDILDATAVSVPVRAYGGHGDDVLLGGSADDHLEGGSGRDRLEGRAGSDYLEGGVDLVADILIGGTGADSFRRDNRVVYSGFGFTGRWPWGFNRSTMRFVNVDEPRDFSAADGDRLL